MDKQNTESVPTKPVEQKSPSYGNKNWKRLVLIYIGIAAILYAGIYYFFMQRYPSSTTYPKQISSPTPKANLNPNTGNLYKDIDSRLREVIK